MIQCSHWLQSQGLGSDDSRNISLNFLKEYRDAPSPPNKSSTQEQLNIWRKNIWQKVLPKDYSHLSGDHY